MRICQLEIVVLFGRTFQTKATACAKSRGGKELDTVRRVACEVEGGREQSPGWRAEAERQAGPGSAAPGGPSIEHKLNFRGNLEASKDLEVGWVVETIGHCVWRD